MPDQIPDGCVSIKNNLDQLNFELARLRQQLEGADPSDIHRIQNLVGAKQRQVTAAQFAFNACLANPPIIIIPPPEHIPGVPDQCIDLYKKLNKLFFDLKNLLQTKKESGTADVPNIDNLIGAKRTEIARVQFDYNTCNPPPPPPPAPTQPRINLDQTLVPVQKIIPWGFVQAKMDEFFNNRVDPPVFHIRLDNNSAGSPPASIATISIIGANVVNGTVTTVYNPITTLNIGGLSGNYYFQDINSDKISVSIDPLASEPVTIKINFECDGPSEMASTYIGVPDIDFREFYITLKLSFGVTRSPKPVPAQCTGMQTNIEAKQADLAELQQQLRDPSTNHAFLAKQINALDQEILAAEKELITCVTTYGAADPFFNGQLDFLAWTDKLNGLTDDDLDNALTQYIVSHIVPTDPLDIVALELCHIVNKTMSGKIYDRLRDPATRSSLNKMISRWILGGDGSYDVLPPLNDGQNLTVNYFVPAGKSDPFPDSMFRPAGWPYHNNPNPDPAIDLSIPSNLSNIKHLVVLTMENRSFDHMLGYLSLPASAGGMGRTDVDGLKLDGTQLNTFQGNDYTPSPFAPGDTAFPLDPNHSFEPVFKQINTKINVAGSRDMDGFVSEFAKAYPDFETPEIIMGYQTAANVPVYDALARDFGISDRWFAAHPGPTFCNRFYELTGRLNLTNGLPGSNAGIPPVPENTWEFSNSSPLTPVFNKTIFDHLTEYGKTFDQAVTWKYYEHGYSFLRFFSRYTFNNTNVVNVDDPLHGFYADARNGTLPSVSYIDPHFIELPPNSNCDGPVADIKSGQALVRKVVEAVVTSPQFVNTLLIVTYDEHGGFYDHVVPFAATPFSADLPIKTYGVRVPAFFVSPWVKAGSVFGHNGDQELVHFDHTSILKTIARRFMSKNPPYMGARYETAKDLTAVLDTTWRRPQFLPFIRYNFAYNASQMMMDASGPNGTLWQLTNRDTDAQAFSFEQVGDWVYIRTHVGGLYLTIDVTSNAITSAPAQGFGIRQDVKYQAGQAGVDVKYQLWRLIPPGTAGAAKNTFVIVNDFFPNKVLQPLTLMGGAHLVLVDKPAIASVANAWTVTSPSVSS